MQGKALNLILNCVELRTNHEPYVVYGMVQGKVLNLTWFRGNEPERRGKLWSKKLQGENF
jgi:hypothetical protein